MAVMVMAMAGLISTPRYGFIGNLIKKLTFFIGIPPFMQNALKKTPILADN
jgi:hypothetical protein